MSVDPVIQSPTNSQSINPYSYIMNNPLSGTDPTGYASCSADDAASCQEVAENLEKGETADITQKQSVTGSRIKRNVKVGTMTGNGNGTVNIQIGNMSATADIGAPSSTSKRPNVNVDGNNVTRTTESPLDDFSPEELKGTNFNVLWGQDYSGEGGTERMFADYEYLSGIYDKVVADRSWGEKLFYGAFGDPNAPQLPILEAGVGKGVRIAGSLAARWLSKGPKNTSVYLGIKGGKDVYVGITRQAINIRQAQHGSSRFTLERVTSYSLTRNQARAVEQALILRNPQYLNKINSISSKRPIYNHAVKWGDEFLKGMGL